MIKSHFSHRTIVITLMILALTISFGVLVAFMMYFKNRGGDIMLKQNAATAPAPEPTIGSAEIMITEDGFSPSTVAVSKGWQVTWVNEDDVPHRVATDPYPAVEGQTMFDSEALAPGETFGYTFNEVGTYTYHDITNPLEIKGTILVK